MITPNVKLVITIRILKKIKNQLVYAGVFAPARSGDSSVVGKSPMGEERRSVEGKRGTFLKWTFFI